MTRTRACLHTGPGSPAPPASRTERQNPGTEEGSQPPGHPALAAKLPDPTLGRLTGSPQRCACPPREKGSLCRCDGVKGLEMGAPHWIMQVGPKCGRRDTRRRQPREDRAESRVKAPAVKTTAIQSQPRKRQGRTLAAPCRTPACSTGGPPARSRVGAAPGRSQSHFPPQLLVGGGANLGIRGRGGGGGDPRGLGLTGRALDVGGGLHPQPGCCWPTVRQ